MEYIIAGAIAGVGISAAQKKDPMKGALYGAATGGIGASMIGSSPKGVISLPPIPKKATLTTQPSPRPQAVQLEAVKERE